MKNRKGISLIVLVITIIVMIVLVSAVIVTLNNTSTINKANEATEITNVKQVEQIANLAWADAYLGNAKTDSEFEKAVLDSLENSGINTDDYIIEVTDKGVTVTLRPQLNEYGFYYKQLYYSESEGMGFIFYPNGELSIAQLLLEDETAPLSSRLAVMNGELMGGPARAEYSDKSIIIEGTEVTVSDDGKELIGNDGSKLVCNFDKVHYTYWNSEYIGTYNGQEVKIDIDSKGNLSFYIGGEQQYSFIKESLMDSNRHMAAMIGSNMAILTSLDGENFIMLGATPICCKRSETKTSPNVSAEIYTGTWETKKETTNGYISKAVVTNGSKEIELGTLINYMPQGVGPTAYKGAWILFGTDEQGRLLIASAGIIEELEVKGKKGYDEIVSILEAKAKNYKDGKIGISARNITFEDLVDLFDIDLSSQSYYSPYYGDTITYSWNGNGANVGFSYVIDGGTRTATVNGAYTNGFTYKDENTNQWVTVPYVEGQTGEIYTMTHKTAEMDYTKLAEGLELRKFLSANSRLVSSNANSVLRLVSANFQRGYAWGPHYGVYAFETGLETANLLSSHGDEYTVYGTPCAIVTLSPNVKLKESSTISDGYDISL